MLPWPRPLPPHRVAGPNGIVHNAAPYDGRWITACALILNTDTASVRELTCARCSLVLNAHPIPHRARLLAAKGMSWEELAHNLNITPETLSDLIAEHPEIAHGRTP